MPIKRKQISSRRRVEDNESISITTRNCEIMKEKMKKQKGIKKNQNSNAKKKQGGSPIIKKKKDKWSIEHLPSGLKISGNTNIELTVKSQATPIPLCSGSVTSLLKNRKGSIKRKGWVRI